LLKTLLEFGSLHNEFEAQTLPLHFIKNMIYKPARLIGVSVVSDETLSPRVDGRWRVRRRRVGGCRRVDGSGRVVLDPHLHAQVHNSVLQNVTHLWCFCC
jgi:hypothetical protein